MGAIFVFGSNLAGRHGKGAALHARQNCGAKYGVGVGRTGNAYAIPTKDEQIRTLPLERIVPYVADFIVYAGMHPDLEFEVTRIGCGLAGYTDSQIAPMLKDAPSNCKLPVEWKKFIEIQTGKQPDPVRKIESHAITQPVSRSSF